MVARETPVSGFISCSTVLTLCHALVVLVNCMTYLIKGVYALCADNPNPRCVLFTKQVANITERKYSVPSQKA